MRAASLALADLLHGRGPLQPGAPISAATRLPCLSSRLSRTRYRRRARRGDRWRRAAAGRGGSAKAALAARARGSRPAAGPPCPAAPKRWSRVRPIRFVCRAPRQARRGPTPCSLPPCRRSRKSTIRRWSRPCNASRRRRGWSRMAASDALSLAALNRPAEALVRQLRRRARHAPRPAAGGASGATDRGQCRASAPAGAGARRPGSLDMPVIVGRPDRQTPMMRVRLNGGAVQPALGRAGAQRPRGSAAALPPRPAGDGGEGLPGLTVVDGERVEVDPTRRRLAERQPPNGFPIWCARMPGATNAPGADQIHHAERPKTSSCTTRPTGSCSAGRTVPSPPAASGWGRPMDLLDVALEGTPGWDRARASSVLESRGTTGVGLARSLPVRLHYTTAVVEEGEVRVRPDIYGLDEAYARAMDRLHAPRSRRRWASRRAWPACAEVRAAPFRLSLLWRSRIAFGRREVVRAGLAGLGLAGLGGSGGAALAQAVARRGGGGSRRLAVQRVQTGENFDGIYWRDGRYDREALAAARLGVPRSLHGRGDADGPAPLRRAAQGCAAARRLRALPGDQRLRAPETNEARARHRAAFRASACTCRAWRRMCGCRGATRWPWRGWRRRCRWAASGSIAAMASCTWIAVRRGAGRPGSRTSAAPVLQHRGASGGQGRVVRSGGGRRGGCRASGVSHQAREASQPSPGGGGGGSRHSPSPGGQRRRTCIWASCPRQGRTRRSQGAPSLARQVRV